MANHKKRKQDNEPMKIETWSKYILQSRQARENARHQDTVGFGFASDWLIKRRELFKSITERIEAQNKTKESKSGLHSTLIWKLFLDHTKLLTCTKRKCLKLRSAFCM